MFMQRAITVIFGLLCVLSPALKAQQQLTILKAIYTGGDVHQDVIPFKHKGA